MSQLPPDRYGKPGPLARLPRKAVAAALGALVVLTGLGIAYVGYVKFGPQDVDAEVVNSRIVDNSAIAVTFTVTRKHPGQPVYCVLRVRDKDGRLTGQRQVTVPGSSSGTVTVDTVVHSSAPPTVDELTGCGTTVPKDLSRDTETG
jgi:hypothetical protein